MENYKNKTWLKNLYIDKKYSSTDIAKICGCSYSVVLKWLKKLEINVRTLSESLNTERAQKKLREFMGGDKNPMRGKFGENNPNWKGGVVTRNKGYTAFYMPWHPNAHQGYVFEHILKASQVLERPLRKNERVHHINGIKDDNRNKNLLICDLSYHSWLHTRMSQLYMKEHFINGI